MDSTIYNPNPNATGQWTLMAGTAPKLHLLPPMSNPSESAVPVLRLAVISRILVLTLIIFWRLLFDPYDTSASLNPSCIGDGSPPSDSPIRWPAIGAAIEDSVVWDGVYFVRIAECGYEYEQSYAFLPLLPISMVLISKSG